MTLLLVDVASYQDDLRTADVAAAGFSAVNLKVSHGLTQKAVHPDITGWVTRARAADLGICTFHFLDASAPGAQQAGYAYAQLQHLGLTTGTAHQVDCESSATWDILTDYVTTITGLLGRPVAVYTGDWWWQPRGWPGAQLSPYLWSAPNAGYLDAYPGDDSSPHWAAGYGGWPHLSVMQYAVEPLFLPDGTTGVIDVSKSAIRDPAVWAALTGGAVAWYLNRALTNFRAEVNARWPARDKSSDGTIGDEAHQATSSDHNPDAAGQPDAGSVDAWDMDVTGVDVQACLRAFQAHESSSYWIYNDHICFRSEGWVPRSYAYAGAGRNRHTQHVHFNTREAYEASSKPWGIKEDEDMANVTDIQLKKLVDAADAVLNPVTYSDGSKRTLATAAAESASFAMHGRTIGKGSGYLTTLGERVDAVQREQVAARLRDEAILRKLTEDDADANRVIAAIQAEASRITAALSALPGAVRAEVEAELEELQGEGGIDGAVVQAATERALSRLRIALTDDSQG